MNNPQQVATVNQDLIRQLLADGLEDEARKIEENVRKLNPHLWIGSVFTERWLDKFITADADMLKLKESIRKLAAFDDPVVIYGETGTGKEILAHALHASRQGPFEVINCAAIPELLLESILFGHKKGSFTGAEQDNVGLMRTCFNGTLFMDEIGELPALMQGKLLRAIQERKVRAIGDNTEKDINCRFLFATNQQLRELVTEKKFRADLYYRIAVVELNTKPLRDRGNDYYLIAQSLGYEGTEEDLYLLTNTNKNFSLLGNVRELQNIIRRMQVLK